MKHNIGTSAGAATVSRTPLNRGPQPAWMTLNDARERAFTGEIVFEIEPEVRAYLDNGVVYYAERATDSPLGQRLIGAGLVDHEQLERGTVRVGDVEHLGRLFEREPSVDRDAVLVVTESESQVLLAEVANDAICAVRSTAYRHHPSGLHRWFATPVDSSADRRFGSVSSLETSVIDDIPGLPDVTERTLADQLYIEWDEPIIGGARVVADEPLVEEFDESLLQAMLDESAMQYDVIEFDQVAEIDQVVEMTTVEIDYPEAEAEAFRPPVVDETAIGFEAPAADDPTPSAGATTDDIPAPVVAEEFLVMWPSGADDVTAEHGDTVEAVVDVEPETPDTDSPDTDSLDTDSLDTGTIEPALGMPSVAEPEADDTPQTADDLAMTPIETWDDEIVAEVPTEVADAVKRAIAALERITGEHPVVAAIPQPSELEDPNAPRLAAPVPAPFAGGFAPPSLDMSAEAIYARATAEMEAQMEAEAAAADVSFDGSSVVQPIADDDDVHGTVETVDDTAVAAQTHAPAAGVASVVFVDDVTPDEPGDDSNDRSSALRRLIGSLRRKDR